MTEVLMPLYMKNFACIGSRCEDDCCKHWLVLIDKKTYTKYMEVKDPLLSERFSAHCQQTLGTTDTSYAFLNMDQDQNCYFKTNEGLCLIHQKLGPSYLSISCATYPRIINAVNDSIELSGVLSCPEIVRLALLNPHKLRFKCVATKKYIAKTYGLWQKIDLNLMAGKWQYFTLELRDFTIRILQERSYGLNDRIIFLGMFLRKAQEYVNNQCVSELPQLIVEYREKLKSGIINDLSNQFNRYTSIQYQLLQEMCKIKTEGSARHTKLFPEILSIILDLNHTAEHITGYQEAYLNFYKPFITDHEYIFENYLVDYVFRNIFPFSEDSNKLFESYLALIIHYSLMRFHLIIRAGLQQKIDAGLLVEVFYQFARCFEHNRQYLEYIYQLLNDNDLSTLSHMVILILNPEP